MPVKQQQRQQVNTFIGGFVTEASPLNFPENATRYEKNFEIDRRGFRRRRLGMELTTFLIPRTNIPIDDGTFKVFLWEGVGGDSTKDFLIVLTGRDLQIFDYNLEGYPHLQTIQLNIPAKSEVDFTTVNGKMIMVCGGAGDIYVFENNGNNTTFTTGRLLIRDLWGVEETPEYEKDINYRGPLTPQHRYNLQNQSWGIPRYAEVTEPWYITRKVEKPNPDFDPRFPPSSFNRPTITVTEQVKMGDRKVSKVTDPIDVYFNHYKKSPANSEQVWQGIQMQPVSKDQQPFEKMFPQLYEQVLGMYPESAKGYFVIDALNRGNSRKEAVRRNLDNHNSLNRYEPNLPEDRVTGGATVVSGFAGRLFYSGFSGGVSGEDARSVNYHDAILFSQQVTATGDVFKCYQEGDPTSREAHDVVDTDGGLIKISGMNGVMGLIPSGSNLIVLAKNGVWSIKGGGNYGFTATNYSVEKLSTFGCISKASIVAVGEEVFYWSEDGIYRVGKDQYGDYVVNSITVENIHSYYTDIPQKDKEAAFGEHSAVTKEVSWLFSTTKGTTELKFDLVLGAFSVHEIKFLGNQRIRSLFRRKGVRYTDTDRKVSVGFDQVVAEDKEVITKGREERSVLPGYEYVVCCSDSFSVALANKQRTDYKDWGILDAEGVLETGDMVAGDVTLEKQINYLDVFMKRGEQYDSSGIAGDSSCYLTTKWNFANSNESGKWSTPEQVFRPVPLAMKEEDGVIKSPFDVQKTRITPRGMGQSVVLRFVTEEGKDCELLGWSITWTGNPIT